MEGERIGGAQEIPHKFLENILLDLRQAGPVASQRGVELREAAGAARHDVDDLPRLPPAHPR